jgi:hypothetical protein
MGREEMMLLIAGGGIVLVGIWYAVTGSPLPGIAVAAIGTVVIAVVYGATAVCRAVGAAATRLSVDLDALAKVEGAVSGIESCLGEVAREVDEKTKHVVAAILTTAALPRNNGEPEAPGPITASTNAPPYVRAARAEMAAEVLRQRLTGRTHEEALLCTAEKFGRSENIISEAWDTHRTAAYKSVIQEVDRQSWEFTEQARTTLREISPSEIEWRQFHKKRGRLGEVIPSIREEFIAKHFQGRVERGVVLESHEDEAKALLDEIKIWLKDTSKMPYPEALLPTVKTIMDVIDDQYWKNWGTQYELEQIQERNYRYLLKSYRKVTRDLRLYVDWLGEDPF